MEEREEDQTKVPKSPTTIVNSFRNIVGAFVVVEQPDGSLVGIKLTNIRYGYLSSSVLSDEYELNLAGRDLELIKVQKSGDVAELPATQLQLPLPPD